MEQEANLTKGAVERELNITKAALEQQSHELNTTKAVLEKQSHALEKEKSNKRQLECEYTRLVRKFLRYLHFILNTMT